MPDIVNTVESINSIEKLYPKLRQHSKQPTFLLTYGGTHFGLVDTVGLTKEAAKSIENNYHELYAVSDAWVANKIEQATHTGYVVLAFGGRLRTPILKQTILGNKNTPYEAKQESRTAGNALGQSYGMMCNRAAIEMQQRVLASKYALDIKPVCMIHDALYFIIKNTIGCIEWFNKNLTECMAWQELEAIQHDIVKISASVDLFYPNWSTPIGLPNKVTKQQILNICREANEKV